MLDGACVWRSVGLIEQLIGWGSNTKRSRRRARLKWMDRVREDSYRLLEVNNAAEGAANVVDKSRGNCGDEPVTKLTYKYNTRKHIIYFYTVFKSRNLCDNIRENAISPPV